jgi:hypothetical protein
MKKQLNKKDKQKYDDICSIVWGCSPIDFEWAQSTKIYNDELVNQRVDYYLNDDNWIEINRPNKKSYNKYYIIAAAIIVLIILNKYIF